MSNRSVGTGLVMLLLLAVLVPSVCLLWFMSQAVKSERSVARQKLLEAYRGHLALAQERLEKHLEDISTDLERSLERAGPIATFALVVRSNLADTVMCFDGQGVLAYPGITQVPKVEAVTPEWEHAQGLELTDPRAAAAAFARLVEEATNSSLAARAIQAEVRNLVRAGTQKEEAVSILDRSLAEKRFEGARDSQNRLIIADLELMALELETENSKLQNEDPGQRLINRLANYDGEFIPASQRRFLMHEFAARWGQRPQPLFPTLAAEDLAARILETGPPRIGEPGVIRAGPIPGVWQISSTHRRVLMLERAENLEARLSSWVPTQSLPADVKLIVLPPGKDTGKALLPMPAGAALPGWRVALALKDERLFDTAADQRIASFVWIGVLVLATVFILAALVLRLVRRQAALTQLRNDLVANVTHELKTPLSSMRLLVDTLLNSAKLSEQTTREYLRLIAGENLRLSRLIDNFLTFSRIERNKYSFKFEEMPAARIVEDAVASVRDRFEAPGCELKVETSPNLPSVLVDGDAMVTALINLLDNAFKYTGDEKRISLNAAAENGSVQFSVKDNGIGLLARDTKRIFKRFYQVDQRLTRSGGGCGLGLSIVKFIVTAHHGKIEVESEPGKGSEFTVSIPVSPGGRGRPRNEANL